ncbi:MAG: FkbM family methyltransferase [Chthoniobacterales bacterium]
MNTQIRIINGLRRRLGYRFPQLGIRAMNLFYKFMPATFEADLFPGINAVLNKNDLTQRSTYWQGSRFEYPTASIMDSWVTPETTHFFDIGSNYGFFSFWMISQNPSLSVHAFEPNPTTFAAISAIKKENALGQLHLWNIGLGDVSEKLSLHPGSDDSGHSTFGNHPGLKCDSLTDIQVMTFSEWLRMANLVLPLKPAWIAKIDVEGFEMKVLAGLEEALKTRVFQGVVIEINPFTLGFCGVAPEDIFRFMKACGYKRRDISDRSGNAFFIPA